MGSRCRCGDESELLDHLQPVEHQVERDVLPLAEAEHLDVVQIDGAPGRLELAHGAVEDTVMGPGERALLDGDVIDDLNVIDLDVGVGDARNQPA